ncbi:MAG: SCP2 sterol-binding domain-containing protein [Candidatus Hodarchaeales archaeon]|jgi:putative sterol carrier protein
MCEQHLEILNSVIASLEEHPEIIDQFISWGKIVQLCLSLENSNEDFYIDFSNSTELSIQEGLHDNPNFIVRTTLDILTKMIIGELDTMDSVITGLVNIEGSITEALEFSELLTIANNALK